MKFEPEHVLFIDQLRAAAKDSNALTELLLCLSDVVDMRSRTIVGEEEQIAWLAAALMAAGFAHADSEEASRQFDAEMAKLRQTTGRAEEEASSASAAPPEGEVRSDAE